MITATAVLHKIHATKVLRLSRVGLLEVQTAKIDNYDS
jgi:hypothetical protein